MALSISRAANAGKPLRGLKALWRDRRGATALEFAMVAMPFIMMIMACFELALIVLVSVSLDIATEKAAREIRTGVTTSSTSLSDFKTKICNNISWLGSSCVGNLQVDVRTYDNFALAAQATTPIKDGAYDSTKMSYAIGGGSKIQLVRAYYQWKMFTPFLKTGMTTLSNGNAVLSSKVVFRNEPF
ncbi:pilus assembly protein [Asticcacaulis sp. BYS171W]|uniref:Pilus assembly protein n=1 Tax=Asticcacaulis aquaticus TaxID=2984212 RepID=A0ABT5HYK3_9CAUL|nr:TadE/TadG family type IV pilus assembly protein [Asticcacaulis aquaticus]MDC7685155.1 pilus assembly protein [Asticcacaulis aquaticus]